MDSTTVSREVKRRIWTLLKEAGFGTFTTRTAWRHGDDGVDVFNVQSFSKYNADAIGVTPHSFRVNLGWFPAYIPPRWPPKVKDGKLLPDEAECLLRGMLLPTMSAPSSNAHVWAIDVEGKNLSCPLRLTRPLQSKRDDWARCMTKLCSRTTFTHLHRKASFNKARKLARQVVVFRRAAPEPSMRHTLEYVQLRSNLGLP